MLEKLYLRTPVVWTLDSTDFPNHRSLVVDYLSAESQNKNIGVACIYLNHKETEMQTPPNLLSGLWRQLVHGKSMDSLSPKLYEQHSEKGTRPSLSDVREVLFSAVAEWAKVYIILDAVDEYPEDERRILLNNLVSMGPTVNLMMTARPHITPADLLAKFQAIDINANTEDIGRYVDARIQMSTRLSKHIVTRPELQEEVRSKIMSSVDGM